MCISTFSTSADLKVLIFENSLKNRRSRSRMSTTLASSIPVYSAAQRCQRGGSPLSWLKWVYIAALVVRLALVAFGQWQDANLPVKYTDIDYIVFSDAARHVSEGRSPFERATYRYSPLLAYLLVPNITLDMPSFGKLIFVLVDLWVGRLLENMLMAKRNNKLSQSKRRRQRKEGRLLGNNGGGGGCGGGGVSGASGGARAGGETDEAAEETEVEDKRVVYYTSAWLLNPLGINMCTRGSADGLVALLLLGSLACLPSCMDDDDDNGSAASSASSSSMLWLVLSAVLYGLSVHYRIYPIVFAPAYLFYLDALHRKNSRGTKLLGLCSRLTHLPLFVFGAVSGGLFLGLTAAFYRIYGHTFLHETYLYHFFRSDIKHNFSVYFYFLYLNTPNPATAAAAATAAANATVAAGASAAAAAEGGASAFAAVIGVVASGRRILGLLAFLPQWTVALALAARFGGTDLPFCMCVQTMSFVAFNKVCTAQYFSWYHFWMPLVFGSMPTLNWRHGISMAATWLVSELSWLGVAYFLELEGLNMFLPLWLASTVFFLVNIGIIVVLVRHHSSALKLVKED